MNAKRLVIPIFIIVLILAAIILRKGAIFFLLALLPSLMAYFVDADAKKSRFKTVFACNLAATLPSIAPMAQAGLEFRHYDVMSLMSSAQTWLFVYGGAAAGWCLVFLCRIVARMFIVLTYEYKISALEQTQLKLLEEWGQELQPK